MFIQPLLDLMSHFQNIYRFKISDSSSPHPHIPLVFSLPFPWQAYLKEQEDWSSETGRSEHCWGFRGICSVALPLTWLQVNYSLISNHSTHAIAVLLKSWVMSVFNTIPVYLIPCFSWWDISDCSLGISSEYSEVVHLSTFAVRACAFTELPFSSEIASPKIHTNPWRLSCPCSEALVHVHASTHKVYTVWSWIAGGEWRSILVGVMICLRGPWATISQQW